MVVIKKRGYFNLPLPLLGLGSLIWFLLRVIPKPSRAAYPCMRIAAPMASTFVLWILGIGASFLFLRRARFFIRRSRYCVAIACIAAAGITGGILISSPHSPVFAALKTDNPVGDAKGANPGRVVWVHDSNATNWAGLGDGHWWESSHTNQTVVDQMMSQSLRVLSGKTSDSAAWDTLFRYFNVSHGRGNHGYIDGEKIAIKVNLVYCIYRPEVCSIDTTTYSLYKNLDYPNTSPQVIRALLRQLVNVVGLNQADISVGDPTCYYPNEYFDSCHAEFPDVHYMDYGGKFGRIKVEFSAVPVYWSCRPLGVAQDYVPRHYAEATYLINLAVMKNHGMVGVTLCAKNHFGSFIRTPDAAGYYDMHTSVASGVPQNGNYRVFVDLMGHAHLGGKTMLCLIDALYGGTMVGDTLPYKWSAPPFNGDWPSSLFASQDQVAIESVVFDVYQLDDEPRHYPQIAGAEDHLVEAALANNPPSGTFYDPNHDIATERLPSLGVFEHWNDSMSRQYSRNLGTGNGIELVFIDGATSGIKQARIPVGNSSTYLLRALPAAGAVELFVPRNGEVKLSLFDCRGRIMGNLIDGYIAYGNYRVKLSPASGKPGFLSPGTYIAALYYSGNGMTRPAVSCMVPIVKR
ncbi:MAG: DUF362 domain-containing protein [Chitinispirillaceae bacterium]|nr:DUF362 domain-containing protein [Chitinispirillaceae bacterium]